MKSTFVTSFVLSCVVLTFGLASPAQAGESATAAAAAADASSEVVAYYFFGNFRCATCKKLEAFSEEAISQGFAESIAAGQLEWRTVNTDEKQNKHFVKDFELVTKSLVLVEYQDGEVVRYNNLKLIWQLVGDKDGFLKYVRDQTRDFLEAS